MARVELVPFPKQRMGDFFRNFCNVPLLKCVASAPLKRLQQKYLATTKAYLSG
jgi:hypothetical protein